MTNRRNGLAIALSAVALAGALAIWLAFLVPDRRGFWLVAGLTVPMMWTGAELLDRDKSMLRLAVAGAAMLIASHLAVVAAREQGLIAADDAALDVRLLGIAGGLILAAFGNVIPKKLVRYDPAAADAGRKQAFQRFCGRLFVLAGLASALIWALAPVSQAALWSMVPVAGGVILVAMGSLRRRDLQKGGA